MSPGATWRISSKLADEYTISDNYHQPGMGGTGLDSILAGFGDAIYYTDGKGNAAVPPTNQIENPDAQPGTNNWYVQDGYGARTAPAAAATANAPIRRRKVWLRS